MNKEIQALIRRIGNVHYGQPWFGRALVALLEEVDEKKVTTRPMGSGPSMLELLWHMNTWAGFTLKRLELDKEEDLASFEKLDWRTLDPRLHSWKKGVAVFKKTQKKIIGLLKKKEDAFLKEMVDYRNYNYQFLLNGMIEHNIYHTGQIIFLNKMLK
jgi:uncharacterized damage-inducible protein DinB